jgi:hypothetical protein
MNGRMLGRIGWVDRRLPGQKRCGECEIGWPRGRRAQKRREQQATRREIVHDLAGREI